MPNLEMSRYYGAIPVEDAAEMAGQFQMLQKLDSWQSFMELIKAAKLTSREQALESISLGDPNSLSQALYWKGYVDGLDTAAKIPKGIIDYVNSLIEQEKAAEIKAKAAEERSPYAWSTRNDTPDMSFASEAVEGEEMIS